jgi:hypothetical protein
VGGSPRQVDFRITPIDSDTPSALRNEVRMFEGRTDHPMGISYADAIGGTKAFLNVASDGFQHGAGPHELNHLGGAKDAYFVDANGNKTSNPARAGDIMNQLPGRMTDAVIQEIMTHENNVHEGAR